MTKKVKIKVDGAYEKYDLEDKDYVFYQILSKIATQLKILNQIR